MIHTGGVFRKLSNRYGNFCGNKQLTRPSEKEFPSVKLNSNITKI